MEFGAIYYEVARFDGDYAYLRRTDEPAGDEKLVALALLPEGITEGTKLKFEMFQYEVV